jgi:hypothetical protein
MVTLLIPATEPAKVTSPEPVARTGEAHRDSKSNPQWPPSHVGSNREVTGPSTGGERHRISDRTVPDSAVIIRAPLPAAASPPYGRDDRS